MAQQGVQNMDDDLYRAAQANGPAITPINFLGRTVCDRNNVLHVAVQYGNLKFINQFLEIVGFLLGEQINEPPNFDHVLRNILMVRDGQGDTPLHKAIIHGHDRILRTLLVRGRLFDPRVEGNNMLYRNMVATVNNKGRTIFHYVVEENKDQLEENKDQLEENKDELEPLTNLLMDHRSLAYMRDNDGLTPLHIAFKHGLYQMVESMLRMSPQSIEIRDNHGKSPLHYAKMDRVFLKKCRAGFHERLQHLLINMVDDDGNTALHVALIGSDEDAAYQLFKFNGCNSRLRNKQGIIPWDLCKSNKNIPHKSKVYVALRRNSTPQSLSHSTMFLEDEDDVKNWMDKIAVAAALLLPLNFAATFSVPGGYDNVTGKPIYREHHTFHTYSIANMLAFLATVFILISCTFGIGKRVKKRQLAKVNIFLLQVALFTTVIAYVAGIFVIGDIGHEYKIRLPVILLSLGVGIVISLMLINWFD